MKVILKRHFYGDKLYRRNGDKPVTIPDHFKDKLPKDAEVVEDKSTMDSKAKKET